MGVSSPCNRSNLNESLRSCSTSSFNILLHIDRSDNNLWVQVVQMVHILFSHVLVLSLYHVFSGGVFVSLTFSFL